MIDDEPFNMVPMETSLKKLGISLDKVWLIVDNKLGLFWSRGIGETERIFWMPPTQAIQFDIIGFGDALDGWIYGLRWNP